MVRISEAIPIALRYQQTGRPDLTEEICQRILAVEPDHAEAMHLLGAVATQQGRCDEAVELLRRAIRIDSTQADYFVNLATALRMLGRIEEAVEAYATAMDLLPSSSRVHSNYLCALRYHPGTGVAALTRAHAEYDRRHAAPLHATWPPHTIDGASRRLRLGFVSPGFCVGPTAHFLIRALENLDRGQCEVACFCDGSPQDQMSRRFQSVATAWHAVTGLTDEELAARIRAARIDILFDLRGHAPRNRLLVFARKPAPVQITWIDSVGTTGLSAVDCVLADRFLLSSEAESHYTEKVLRLPDGYVCYDPPSETRVVGPLPALARGHITFGSFNQPAKMNPAVVQLWARILRRVGRSRLVLKYRGLNTPSAIRYWQQRFEAEGVDIARLEFQGYSPYHEFFAEYDRIDISLDPFPHNGGVTTCHSLWMGVPVVTCPGETFASRQSLSHLSNIGLTETIARDLDEYVEIAVGLAQDLPRLANMRAELRPRMAASPLCDGQRFAANLMALLRNVWREWCSTA